MPKNQPKPIADSNGEIVSPVGFFTPAFTASAPAPLVAADLSNNAVDEYKWNENRTALVKVGTFNLQERIQAAAKGVTIYEVLERARRGDVDALAQVEPDAVVDTETPPVDVSEMPETMADAADILHDAPIILAKQKDLEAQQAALAKNAAAVLSAGGDATKELEGLAPHAPEAKISQEVKK